MIYVLDNNSGINPHGQLMSKIIKHHTTQPIEIIEIHPQIKISILENTINDLLRKIKPTDVVLVSWAIEADYRCDELFDILGEHCFVVVAAGNTNEPIENFSPTRSDNVYCIGCLNKNGVKASLSNFSNFKELIWVCGTNYYVDNVPHSGTSISAAIYAGLLAESIKLKDSDYLEDSLQKYHDKVYQEINHKV